MKLVSSLLVNTAALWACAASGHGSTAETFRRGFELCVVARDANEGRVTQAISRQGQSLLIKLPAVLSSADLKWAKAVTKSTWFVLSGSHLASTLRLKLKPAAVAGFQATLDRVIGGGDQIAILLNGEVVGVLVFTHRLAADEIAIDASFFSDGTEEEKESDTQQLAQQIKSTLY